ncbi:CASP8 and FADD-like apoptosis regulator a [Austrofundulus limnaeus]|uniref:CASP8 and FADD-like apoptosis regulator a n=1 Tax=Austrofundulus limnaeus TaxID=52670 RepID=A0A2I4BWR4_AUSLI|nr:PREDICTED: CASP8 and FADD-like apoptosis regulator [Austrofundulus limnaeus]
MMSPLDQSHLKYINAVAEDLSHSECRKAAYLCGSLEADCSVEFVKQMLKSNVEHRGDASLFLKALILLLGRYDLLRKLYKVGRSDMGLQSQSYANVFPTFRVLMVNISDDLPKKEVEDIKFLLSNDIPREKMESCKTFLDVITELEKLDSVSAESLDVVKKCLLDIGRIDLVKKVNAYKKPESSSQQLNCQAAMGCCAQAQPSPQQQCSRAAEIKQRLHQQCDAKVVVSLPVCREPSRRSLLEHYNFNTNPRGVCVIIDCVGQDGGMLEETFKALHFSVRHLKWLSAEDILSSLRDMSKQRDYRYDCFVCCIISRGSTNYLFGTDTYDNSLPIDLIRGLFTADSCPMLAGKPKLFFIQRYSVADLVSCATANYQDENIEVDGCNGQRSRNIPVEADIFWSHCWMDECQLKQAQHHSVYLKALTDALCKAQRRKTSLLDVQMELNGAIFEHNKRNPGAAYNIDVKHTLLKNLYLE